LQTNGKSYKKIPQYIAIANDTFVWNTCNLDGRV